MCTFLYVSIRVCPLATTAVCICAQKLYFSMHPSQQWVHQNTFPATATKLTVLRTVGFEVLTAVVMKSSIFWDTKQCSAFKFNRHFWGIFRLRLQGRRINCFVASLILRHRRWRSHFSPKRRLTFNGLHGGISQNIELFIQNVFLLENDQQKPNAEFLSS
jgi:hypothetical protein